MPQFQLPIAIGLASGSVASWILFYFARPKEGKIQLPIHADGDDGYEERDGLDVAKPVDLLDGYPIDPDGFWKRMEGKKTTLTLLLTLATVISAVSFGWSIGNDLRSDAVVYALHTIFSMYTFLFALLSIKERDVNVHSAGVFHVSVLLTSASLLLLGTSILPTTPSPVAVIPEDYVLSLLWPALTAVYSAAAAVAMTTPIGPPLHYPPSSIYPQKIVDSITNMAENNVAGVVDASPWSQLLFTYTTKVVWLGNLAESLDIGDLPILPAGMRASVNYMRMREVMEHFKFSFFGMKPTPGSGWQSVFRLARLNWIPFVVEAPLAAVSAVVYYAPPFFLQQLIKYLERDPSRQQMGWGWVYVIGIFASNALSSFITSQLWTLAMTTIQVRLKIQLNSSLFAKTLVRKDIASASAAASSDNGDDSQKPEKDDEDEFSSKAQIMTLMTTDVDRVSEFAWHYFTLIDAPIELIVGTYFLYKLLGVSCFYGLAATCLFLPVNHYAGKVVVGVQENLMKTRDQRVSLMNEILGGIRMIKFMGWERSFEKRALQIRNHELHLQKRNYLLETIFSAIWGGAPVFVSLVAFWHYAVVRQIDLTPSVAFTSLLVFTEMKFALSALPETFINMLQGFVSLRRIEKYLLGAEVSRVPPLSQQSMTIAFQSCTATWPQDRRTGSRSVSVSSTPRDKFVLLDLNLNFPQGELSLICGKLGSGKTLLLLSLLGESDILAGQVLCPRSPLDTVAKFAEVKVKVKQEEWIVPGVCAYVPQSAWLRNASIKDNILFNLPYDEERYQKTLQVCALINDLEILEDGDESEIGERGVNLSGGQKARVSLARAVYSRASILLLDDVLSAVDAHTAHHLFHQCLKGEMMVGRTVILVSHHVQLCAPDAAYIVALDNGQIQFSGPKDAFYASGVLRTLVQSTSRADKEDDGEEKKELEQHEKEILDSEESPSVSEADATAVASQSSSVKAPERKAPRKLVEEEKRAVGRISSDIWALYLKACGGKWYWSWFIIVLVLCSLNPVIANGWLQKWSSVAAEGTSRPPIFYIAVYAGITVFGVVFTSYRWMVLYKGSIHASHELYRNLLESVLFADIRFHDTVSRGRVLNRFGKDFEGIDSSLSDNFGRSLFYAVSAGTTIVSVSYVGGLPFIISALVLGYCYWRVAKIYGQTSRDMRRLDSVTRSPLYSIYGETIAGVTIIRAFGASSKFLRDMLRCVDTNANPYYWMWGVNRWLSVRFNLLSAGVVGATGFACLITPSINASMAGFALAFASSITGDLLFMVRRFVGLEQSMVAVERVQEYIELKREPPEFMEPRPPVEWPSQGSIKCENLVIRYAPELPDVLHNLNFEILPGEKVGILGRTGSGKSTLALSFFRFVEATEGRILIDGLDTSKIGLHDLRSRLTIIPQDPTILSGTLRSTLDVFGEYQDAEIYEALRRVHLIPAEDTPEEAPETINANVFRNLDSSVSEGGENFSTGEKQLLCMARAILKRSKILLMDEATASVDYATDELISQTIRKEFADSTILTIAHRLRTVIDYDRVMLLEQGKIVEFESPAKLLRDPSSKFYSLCKATGKDEFAVLKEMAGVKASS